MESTRNLEDGTEARAGADVGKAAETTGKATGAKERVLVGVKASVLTAN